MKKLNGLINIGNTCYLNSILQLLIQCNNLNKFILLFNIDKFFVISYKQFIIEYLSKDEPIVPIPIIKYLENKNLKNERCQEDASEFLLLFINYLFDELIEFSKEIDVNSDEKELINKIINQLFNIQIKKILCCSNCRNEKILIENDKILSLSIEDFKFDDFNNIIINSFMPKFEDDFKMKCDKCNMNLDNKINILITELPKYLILNIKKFDNNLNKIDSSVNIPIQFEINDNIYILKGLVIHLGRSMNHGHYIYIRYYKNNWYLVDDNSLNLINESDINKYLTNGYLYLYELK